MLLRQSEREPGLLERWRSGPALILALAAFIVLGGIGTLVYNERFYEGLRRAEARSQAEVLAVSVTAALDFEDTYAANDAVSAARANRQVRWVAVFDEQGRKVAGYARPGHTLPATTSAIPASGKAISVIVPVTASGQKIGDVGLEVDGEPLTRRLSRYFLLGALIVLAGLVLAVLGLSQASLRRVNRQLEERAEALAAANVLLAEQMEVRASAEEQLRQSQKMQALGQLTGGIAHDFNNLLTVIQGSADMLTRDNLPEQKRIRYAQAIAQASENAASLTSQLLAFARRQPLKPESVDLNELVGSLRDLLDRLLGERIIVRTKLAANGCPVEVDRAQLQSAILNVASNARDAMKGEGRLTIATSNCIEDDREMVAIDITDTGSGIAPEVQERIFEPFFTTKGTGKGTGLGLSQVYGFATQSGGTVRISSKVGEGSTISIVLPCAEAPSRDLAEEEKAPSSERGTGKILIVEDNEEVGRFAESLLSEQGHDVERATSAEQALELVRAGDFDVVFSDVVMPGMGGLRLAEILASERPQLPVVLATGYSQEIAESGSGGRPVILKPYRLATLQSAINEALNRGKVHDPA